MLNANWKRWCVEIHFKESKYNLSLNNINLKTHNSLEQEIYIYNLIFILYYFFNFENTCIIKDKYKLNNKTGIIIFSENILIPVLFSSKHKLPGNCLLIIFIFINYTFIVDYNNNYYIFIFLIKIYNFPGGLCLLLVLLFNLYLF